MIDPRRACDARTSGSASRVWRAWTLSCGIGEFLGMAVAAGFAALSALLLGEPETMPTRMACLLIMVLAGVLEGTSIGFFQWRVLHRVFPELSLRTWLTATIIVAAVGWFVGMLPPTFLGNGEGGEPIPEPSPLMITIFAALFGSVAGVVFGFAQWLVLRRQTKPIMNEDSTFRFLLIGVSIIQTAIEWPRQARRSLDLGRKAFCFRCSISHELVHGTTELTTVPPWVCYPISTDIGLGPFGGD